MRRLAWLAVVGMSVASVGCGKASMRRILFGDSFLGSYGKPAAGQLQVTNEAAERPALLVAIELRDAATQARVGELAVHLAPGASVDLDGVPAGTYEAVATFDDGLRAPVPPAEPLRLVIAAGAAAVARFGHP